MMILGTSLASALWRIAVASARMASSAPCFSLAAWAVSRPCWNTGDNADQSFSWASSSALGPVTNYHAKVSVVADGQGSVFKLTANYEARFVAEAEARKIIDGGIRRGLCMSSPLRAVDAAHVRLDALLIGWRIKPGQLVSVPMAATESSRRPSELMASTFHFLP